MHTPQITWLHRYGKKCGTSEVASWKYYAWQEGARAALLRRSGHAPYWCRHSRHDQKRLGCLAEVSAQAMAAATATSATE